MVQIILAQGCLLDKIFFRNGHAGGGVSGWQMRGETTLTLKNKTGSFDLETHL